MNNTPLGKLVTIKTGKLDVNAGSPDGVYPFFICSRDTYRINSYSYDCKCVLVAGNGDLNVKYYEGKFDAYQRTYIVESLNESILDTKYLYWFLYKYVEKLRQLSIGGVIKYIKLNNLTDPEIPLLSLSQQKEVVKNLDQTYLIQQKRKKALDFLDEYLKSVFLEMFGDPVINPKRLNTLTLGELAKKVTDGTHKTPKYTTVGVKFISAKNIKQESIDWSDVKYISEEEHKAIYKRCNPEKEDILLTKSGSLGMAAIVDVDFEFSLFESLALLKINKELVDPIYLREYLNLEQIKSLYTRITKGVGVKHLHLIDIKSLPVILPKIDEQKKFVNIVGKTEDIKKKMIKQSEELDMLFQSLLQKSFSSN